MVTLYFKILVLLLKVNWCFYKIKSLYKLNIHWMKKWQGHMALRATPLPTALQMMNPTGRNAVWLSTITTYY